MSAIIELKDCIPTLEELKRRAEQRDNEPASSVALMAMAEHLRGCGYTEANPDVHRAIVEFGASELENRNSRGLFIKGACGIGKSFGVACLAAYFKWPVIPAKVLQAAYMSADSDDKFLHFVDALDYFGRPQTIVIDDLGTEDFPLVKYGTPCNLLADVLDRRYYQGFMRNGVRTIVTCNLTDQQLRERYGLRIDDRMNEMFTFATVEGRSLRK
jgi:DNA replication protein DnaC